MIDLQTTSWPTWTSTRPREVPAFNSLVFLRVAGARNWPRVFKQALPRLKALEASGVHGDMPVLKVSRASKECSQRGMPMPLTLQLALYDALQDAFCLNEGQVLP